MAVDGAVYGTTSIAEIRKIADRIEYLTKEESLDPGADHARQIWSAAGLRELADRRQELARNRHADKRY